jgi:hypothetical protein
VPTRILTTVLLIGALLGAWATPAGAGVDRSSRSAEIVVEWNRR